MYRMRSTKLLALAAVALPLGLVASASQSAATARVPNLIGTWSGTYTTRSGQTGSIDLVVETQTGRRFNGTITDDGTDPLAIRGTVDRRRNYHSIARGAGVRQEKTGRVSRDGNTITGRYRDTPGGTGRFQLNRVN